ncbi:TonB-dependent receptor plug domain-containing protein [Labilibaculum euxinus]
MKRTFLTAFALLSLLNSAVKADEIPNPAKDTTAVKHLNLSEVKINASRVNAKMKDLPQKVEVVTRRMIEATPAVDMGELLKKTAGVDIIQYPGISSAVSMRGFAPSTSNKYNVILIDGKPAGTTNIATIDMSNVERVEILKGPFSAQYGSSAMAGVINIVTKESTQSITGNASVSYGSFETYTGSLNAGGALSESMDFDVSCNYQKQGKDYKIGKNNIYDKDYAETILDPTTYGEKMEHSQFERQNASARLGFILDENWKINIHQSVFIANDVETPGSFWHVNGMNSKDMNKYTTSADVLGKIGNHKLSLSPFHTKEESTTFNSKYGDTENIHKNYGFILQDAFKVGEHSFAFGIDNKNDVSESNKWNTLGDITAPSTPKYKNVSTGIFGQVNTNTLDGKLNIAIGARYDLVKLKLEADDLLGNEASSEEYNVFTQNVGVKYEFLEGLAVHSSWGNAFYAPDAFQKAGMYTTAYGTTKGNPNLKDEQSNTFDVGFEYKNFGKGFNFDFTYFKTHHNNMIVSYSVDPDGTAYNGDEYKTYKNANFADMDGIEIESSFDFGALADYNYSLKLYANYTHIIDAIVTQRVKQTDGTYKNEESQMRYVRDNNANFGIEFDNLNGLSTRLNARYIGHRYEDNWYTYYPIRTNVTEKVLRHPVSMVFDYSASYTIKEKYTIGLSVSNLLDENYTEKDGYNMPGRAITAKFGYKF